MRPSIPKSVWDEFLDFLNQTTTEVKLFYVYDEDGNETLSRKATTTTPRDLKSVISLYEKKYPKYFDPMTTAKIEALTKESKDSESFSSLARKMLSDDYDDKSGDDKK